jgi:hypothetical protein
MAAAGQALGPGLPSRSSLPGCRPPARWPVRQHRAGTGGSVKRVSNPRHRALLRTSPSISSRTECSGRCLADSHEQRAWAAHVSNSDRRCQAEVRASLPERDTAPALAMQTVGDRAREEPSHQQHPAGQPEAVPGPRSVRKFGANATAFWVLFLAAAKHSTRLSRARPGNRGATPDRQEGGPIVEASSGRSAVNANAGRCGAPVRQRVSRRPPHAPSRRSSASERGAGSNDFLKRSTLALI